MLKLNNLLMDVTKLKHFADDLNKWYIKLTLYYTMTLSTTLWSEAFEIILEVISFCPYSKVF